MWAPEKSWGPKAPPPGSTLCLKNMLRSLVEKNQISFLYILIFMHLLNCIFMLKINFKKTMGKRAE